MEYIDQVYAFLINLKPGERISVNSSKNPERFIETVKRLHDSWGLDDFEFNQDYKTLRRMNGFER